MRIYIILLFFLSSSNTQVLFAQHFLDGTWTGNYQKLFYMPHPLKVVVNLQVTSDTIVNGTSHLYYRNGSYEHYVVHGIYHPRDSTIFFAEDSTIAVDLGFGDNCLGNYTMKLSISDTLLTFHGKWQDNSSFFLGCPTTGVWLSKPLATKAVQHKSLNTVPEVQKLIEIDEAEKDSIKIELRDNAQIDGDIVSIYFNDSLIIRNQKLLSKPIVFFLTIPSSVDICNLKMVAESMGSVPPCTALMTVTTKRKRYELNLSSSMSNSGVVQFFLKE
jgi:hypothetical protein